jgi:hypothetical protein
MIYFIPTLIVIIVIFSVIIYYIITINKEFGHLSSFNHLLYD